MGNEKGLKKNEKNSHKAPQRKTKKNNLLCVPLCNFVAKKEAGGLNGLI